MKRKHIADYDKFFEAVGVDMANQALDEVENIRKDFPEFEDTPDDFWLDFVLWKNTFPFIRFMRDEHNYDTREIWKRLYREYLQSVSWKFRKIVMMRNFDNRCQLCYSSGDEITLHLHHRTYERLGSEKPSDLTLLCSGCHAKFHGDINGDITVS